MRGHIGLRTSTDERNQFSALALLYEAHREELVRYVRRTFGRGPPEPEDVVQTAFVHFSALEEPHLVDNPRAFLYRSSRNVAIDQRRRASMHARSARCGDLAPMNECLDELNGERVWIGRDRLRIVARSVRIMRQRQRDALIMHRIDELSYVEIARRLGVSQTSAKRLVNEALSICAQALREAECDV